MTENLDAQCTEVTERRISASVPWFLTASYLYYVHDVSLLSDERFDSMCKEMDARWDEIEHPHKHFITRADVKAGTGYALPFGRLPTIVRAGAAVFCKQLNIDVSIPL